MAYTSIHSFIQSLIPYKKYTNIKKHQNNKETKYGGKDRKANKAWWLSIPKKKKKNSYKT